MNRIAIAKELVKMAKTLVSKEGSIYKTTIKIKIGKYEFEARVDGDDVDAVEAELKKRNIKFTSRDDLVD